MFFAAIFSLLTGIVLYLLGRRGMSVGHHPTCRRCGFDLYLLQSDRCPECGSDIRDPAAVRVGFRRPSFPAIWSGILLASAGILLAAIAAPDWWAHFDGSSYKTTAMLAREVDSPLAARRAAACRELTRRADRGALAPQQIDPIARRLLDLQQGPAAAWDSQWGDLMQSARRCMSPVLWERYLAQLPQVQIEARPAVHPGDPVPLRVVCLLRGGAQFDALMPCRLSPIVTIQADGDPAPPAQVMLGDKTIDSIPLPTEWTLQWQRSAAGEVPGDLVVHVKVALAVQAGKSHAEAISEQVLHVRVAPQTEPLVRQVMPPDSQTRELYVGAVQWRVPPVAELSPGAMIGSLWISGPPVAASYRVVLHSLSESQDRLLARVMVRPDDGNLIPLKLPSTLVGLAPGPATLVCVPDPELAQGTVDVLEIMGTRPSCFVTLQAPEPHP